MHPSPVLCPPHKENAKMESNLKSLWNNFLVAYSFYFLFPYSLFFFRRFYFPFLPHSFFWLRSQTRSQYKTSIHSKEKKKKNKKRNRRFSKNVRGARQKAQGPTFLRLPTPSSSSPLHTNPPNLLNTRWINITPTIYPPAIYSPAPVTSYR